ncbi:MAG: hypothetical protein JXR91_07365 [Deltaproteobacteria bacterium]|nr:hypothetical protein [Deltaproteobacteria bacterium]
MILFIEKIKKNDLYLLALVAILILTTVSNTSNAVEPIIGTERSSDARAISLQDSLRASSSGTASLYLNPASMSMAKVYHVAMNYQFTGRDNLNDWGLVFLDSITSSKIAAGASLNYRKDSLKKSDFESWDARLALSASLGENFSLGFTGRYVRAAQDLKSSSEGPNGSAIMDKSGDIQASGFTFDAGMAIRMGSMMTLAVTGYNLTDTKTIYAPIVLGTGLSLNLLKMIFAETDVELDFTSYKSTAVTWKLGVEFLVQERYAFRTGYAHDFLNGIDRVSAGLGFSSTRFAIDLGYNQDIQFSSRFRLALGIRIFVG